MIRVLHGDCLAILPTLADGSVDSVVTDPPYHLTSMVKRFGKTAMTDKTQTSVRSRAGADGYARMARGFMGKTWDGGNVAMQPETWAEVFRVLKPGGHLLAFGGTRTSHRMVCAIEDAGFEIRDSLLWLYGSGFPKSHDIAKALDKRLGAAGSFGEPKSAAHAGWIERGRMRGEENEAGWQRPWMDDPEQVSNAARKYIPATPEAAAWDGWGSALKPAHEPIVVARKPFPGSLAANVLRCGCGGINIDACRIEGESTVRDNHGGTGNPEQWRTGNGGDFTSGSVLGRWPANVLHDGSDEVMEAFAAFGDKSSARASGNPNNPIHGSNGSGTSYEWGEVGRASIDYRDEGTAARFFYCAKADSDDRAGSKHPTVKPLALMSWLVKLVTPPGGTVLDPFAGSGTTLLAADRLQFHAIGIEKDAEYVADIRRRLVADAGLFAEVAD